VTRERYADDPTKSGVVEAGKYEAIAGRHSLDEQALHKQFVIR
jgi:hypothetical protein